MKREREASEEPAAAEPLARAAGRQQGQAAAVAAAVGVSARQAAAAIRLLRDEQASLPFVARYRKEATQGLDEAALRGIERELGRLEALEAARASVLAKLQKAGVLSGGEGSAALRAAVAAAGSVQELEDLYLPHRPKRSTRASAARDRGLAPLAEAILAGARGACSQQQPLATLAARHVRPPGVPSAEAALAGARDILAERAAELPEARAAARAALQQRATLVCKLSRGAAGGREAGAPSGGGGKAPKQGGKGGKGGGGAADADTFRLYHAFAAPLRSLRPHQVLAIGRGEARGVLSVGLEWDPLALAGLCRRALLTVPAPDDGQQRQQQRQPRADCATELSAAVADGLRRLLRPAAEREARAALAEAAGTAAAAAFARNLRGLLLQPPLPGAAVLGVDPAFRTGCKLAVVDATGRLLETAAVHPHPPAPPAAQEAARSQLLALIDRHDVRAVAVGNGVASRETQRFVAEALAADGGGGERRGRPRQRVGWCVVSEAGASVYSASELAAKELPGVDVSLRGAASIARRLQDPLAELVKVEPASLGVGQYQHDVRPATLAAELAAVVQSVVNQVGVDANVASPALLAHVAGLNRSVAAALVAHRDAHGPFASREQLREVKGLGPKAFLNAAGFLRIRGGANPLDGTAVHPESYEAAQRLVWEVCGGGSGQRDAGEEPPRKKSRRGASPSAKGGRGAKSGGRAGRAGGGGGLTAAAIEAARPALAELLAPGGAARLTAAAAELGLGEPTLRDIAQALLAPERDVRGEAGLQALQFRQAVPLAELQPGMELTGVVRNVADFGAFVDVNCEVDGLVHVSEFARAEAGVDGGGQGKSSQQQRRQQADIHDHTSVGDLLRLRVVSVDPQRRRIGLAPLA